MHLKSIALFGKGVLVKCPDDCVHELLWAGVLLLGSTGVPHGSHTDLAQQFIDNPSGTIELLTRALVQSSSEHIAFDKLAYFVVKLLLLNF
jgi:hypothetical protein